MNRLRSAYVLSVLGCVAACSASNSSKSSNDSNGNAPGTTDPTTVSASTTDSGGGSISSTTAGTGGDIGVGAVTLPTSDPCGASEARKCSLGEKCAAAGDCTSAICATIGTAAGTCISAPSCSGGNGADLKCGPNGNEDCCHTIAVPGGAFTNYNYNAIEPQDPNGQKTPSAQVVAPFALDEFEVTVGRMRAFFTAKGGDLRTNHPATGDGAHPLHANSGWRDSWNERLPGSWAEINNRLGLQCAEGGDNANWGAASWTPDAGVNEQKPANCVDWYTLFAFCAWDGGRMPMDIEWSYVAYGGDKELVYPFGNDIGGATPDYDNAKDVVVTSFLAYQDATFGVYTEGPEYRQQTDGPLHISNVGEKSGRSPWGHADMGGNVIEFLAEVAASVPSTCNNCALDINYPDPPTGQAGLQPVQWQAHNPDGTNLPGDDFTDAKAAPDGKRLARGGSWMGEYEGHILDNVRSRYWYPVWRNYQAAGVRCARDISKVASLNVDSGK